MTWHLPVRKTGDTAFKATDEAVVALTELHNEKTPTN
jgi:hypothetical protein